MNIGMCIIKDLSDTCSLCHALDNMNEYDDQWGLFWKAKAVLPFIVTCLTHTVTAVIFSLFFFFFTAVIFSTCRWLQLHGNISITFTAPTVIVKKKKNLNYRSIIISRNCWKLLCHGTQQACPTFVKLYNVVNFLENQLGNFFLNEMPDKLNDPVLSIEVVWNCILSWHVL